MSIVKDLMSKYIFYSFPQMSAKLMQITVVEDRLKTGHPVEYCGRQGDQP